MKGPRPASGTQQALRNSCFASPFPQSPKPRGLRAACLALASSATYWPDGRGGGLRSQEGKSQSRSDSCGTGRAPPPHLSPLPHHLLSCVPRPSRQLGLGLSGRLWGPGGGEECFPGGTSSARARKTGLQADVGMLLWRVALLPPWTSCCRARGRGTPDAVRWGLRQVQGSLPAPTRSAKQDAQPPASPPLHPLAQENRCYRPQVHPSRAHNPRDPDPLTHEADFVVVFFLAWFKVCLLDTSAVSASAGRTRSSTILSPCIPGTALPPTPARGWHTARFGRLFGELVNRTTVTAHAGMPDLNHTLRPRTYC